MDTTEKARERAIDIMTKGKSTLNEFEVSFVSNMMNTTAVLSERQWSTLHKIGSKIDRMVDRGIPASHNVTEVNDGN